MEITRGVVRVDDACWRGVDLFRMPLGGGGIGVVRTRVSVITLCGTSVVVGVEAEVNCFTDPEDGLVDVAMVVGILVCLFWL